MFLDHKKFVNDLEMLTPTIYSVDAGSMDEEAQSKLGGVAEVFTKITDEIVPLITEFAGNSVIKNELESALVFTKRAQIQASNVIIGEYNTLHLLTKETKLEGKVVNWFANITMRAITIVRDAADFATTAIKDFADGASSNDDASNFMGTLVTKLYIVMAKTISGISDVCFDAERLATRLVGWLS